MAAFVSPGDIAFSLFGFEIYYYGIFMAVAVCLSIIISNYIAAKVYKLNNIVLDISPSVILLGVSGARIYYCLLDYHYYFHHPLSILDFRGGGLSIHGAIIGGALALWYEAKHRNISFANLCDIFSVSLPLAQGIARWGNFFNSEAFGYPTNLPWKLFIPLDHRPDKYINYDYFHPTFLYESILDFIIFFVMLKLIFNKQKTLKPGNMTAIYLVMYSIARIIVEYFRIDCTCFVGKIPLPILISCLIIIGGLVYLFKNRDDVIS